MARGTDLEVRVVLKDALTQAWTGMVQQFGRRAADLIGSIPRVAAEMVQLGVDVEAAEYRFEAFAGGAEEGAAMLAAFNRGADNTVDRMNAMAKSAKLMQMGLVSNTDEMELMAEMAIKLGNQTMDAKDRIDDFALMLANQAVMRLDNFGISSGRVRERIKELIATGQALNREEAFKMAAMEEGVVALEKLGDTSELASTKIDKIKAAVEDAKQGFATMALEAINLTGDVDGLAARIRELPVTVEQLGVILAAVAEKAKPLTDFFKGAWDWLTPVGLLGQAGRKMGGDFKEGMDLTIASLREAGVEVPDWVQEVYKALGSTEAFTKVVNKATAEMDQFGRAWPSSTDFLNLYGTTIGEAGKATKRYTAEVDDAVRAEQGRLSQADAQKKAMEEQNRLMYDAQQRQKEYADAAAEAARRVKDALEKQTLEIRKATIDWSMSYTSYYADVADTAARFEDERTVLEAKHRDRLAELEKKGADTRVWINEAAEEAVLAKLRRSLEIAMTEQAAYTAKTSEATRMRKEDQIKKIEEGIAAQESRLAAYRSGRLVKQGENVDALIAEEQRMYETSLAELNAAQEAEELAQRQSLGRMLLQQFTAWAQMKGVAVEKMIEMQIAISEEYGLITEEGARAAELSLASWELWGEDMSKPFAAVSGSFTDLIDKANRYKDSLNNIPRDVLVSVRAQVDQAYQGHVGTVPTMEQASGVDTLVGGPFGPYNMTVGEEEPERVRVEPVTNNFSMTVNTGAKSSAVIQDFATMQALIGA